MLLSGWDSKLALRRFATGWVASLECLAPKRFNPLKNTVILTLIYHHLSINWRWFCPSPWFRGVTSKCLDSFQWMLGVYTTIWLYKRCILKRETIGWYPLILEFTVYGLLLSILLAYCSQLPSCYLLRDELNTGPECKQKNLETKKGNRAKKSKKFKNTINTTTE